MPLTRAQEELNGINSDAFELARFASIIEQVLGSVLPGGTDSALGTQLMLDRKTVRDLRFLSEKVSTYANDVSDRLFDFFNKVEASL